MPVAHTGYRALPTAAQRALNFVVRKYNRNQADNETRYPPPFHALLQQQPRPASPHIRDALLTDFVSHSFAPPHSFIPPWSSFCQSAKARCQPLPKARAECPHPLCKSFTTRPTHTFILWPPPQSPTPPFLHLILSHFTLQCLSRTLFPSLRSILLRFNHPSLCFLLLHALASTIACVLSISIAIHLPAFLAPLPLTPSIVELPLPSLSRWLSLSHSLTHQDLNLYTHFSVTARQASA